MLEVLIKVNGRTIHRVVAVNRGQPSRTPGPESDWRCYELNPNADTEFGEFVWHRRSEGAVVLALAMLDAAPQERKTIPSDADQPKKDSP